MREEELLENVFQSTLPHGSDAIWDLIDCYYQNFNPRSLTGATI